MRDLSNNSMIEIKRKEISFLQFRSLKKYESSLMHGYTKKDLDFRKGDTYVSNVEILQNALGVKEKWIKTKQTHSDHIAILLEGEEVPTYLEDTDGIITNQKNLMVLTSYADCTPILIYDTQKQVIANIHSGWRGTVQKIGPKALRKMKEVFGTKYEDCEITIGPNIQSCCFEVGEEVKEIFEKTFANLPNWKKVIQGKEKNGENKYWIDTALINRTLFETMGVLPERISESCLCTKCQKEQLHSFRADGAESGRSTMFTILRESEGEK